MATFWRRSCRISPFSMRLRQTRFSIKGATDTDLLLERLLERIFTLVPAERGAVFFAGRKPESLDCAAFRNAPPHVNPDIAMEAVREFTATIRNNGNGASLLCVPLRVIDS